MLRKYKGNILYELKPSILYIHVIELLMYVHQVNTKWVASKYYDRLRNNPIWPNASMKKMLEFENVLKLSRTMVYRVKAKAMSIITWEG